MPASEQRGTSAQRGYGYRWQKARAAYLVKHPLCAQCYKQGLLTPATVVDHVVPHRGDMAVFWDSSNWQGLCKTCHDSWKQRQEKGGVDGACGSDGLPLDPRHHWNQNH